MLSALNTIFSLGAVVAQIFIVVVILYHLFFRKNNTQLPFVRQFFGFIGKHGIALAFTVSLISTLGSLFYSNVAGFVPCDLCWLQRIFMYPLVMIFAISLLKKDIRVITYALPIAVVGGLISLYHNFLYYAGGGLNVICQLGSQNVSCTKRYVFEFGYITIPVMALTAFALIITFLILRKVQK